MQIIDIYNELFARYGNMSWWPAKTRFEVIVGAVLTQNTAWSNVKKAIENFGGDLSPQYIENIDIEKLKEIIKPSGFFNQKSIYLKAVTEWFKKYDYSVEAVTKHPLGQIRQELLKTKGIGFETADSILLYAFEYPSFVVDAYTKRLLERLGFDIKLDYASIKSFFEKQLPADVFLYNNFHALIVANAKEHCRKKPECKDCPLGDVCSFAKAKNRESLQ